MVAVAVVVTVVVATCSAVVGQGGFERDTHKAIDTVVSDREYDGLSTVSVGTQYADFSLFTDPKSVFVEVASSGDRTYQGFANELAGQITNESKTPVTIHVESTDPRSSTQDDGL